VVYSELGNEPSGWIKANTFTSWASQKRLPMSGNHTRKYTRQVVFHSPLPLYVMRLVYFPINE
jgi:hypothetical protein